MYEICGASGQQIFELRLFVELLFERALVIAASAAANLLHAVVQAVLYWKGVSQTDLCAPYGASQRCQRASARGQKNPLGTFSHLPISPLVQSILR